MKVLMFGWEFPPYISGGLGTACYGLTKGLKKVGGVETTFIVPKLHGQEDDRHVKLLGIAGNDVVKNVGNSTEKVVIPNAYGTNLMDEVEKYVAGVGDVIARVGEFDIIHAHDWLTYQAGVEAKRISGKPLVVHVHSTEFDRAGKNTNLSICAIERYGLDMADKIVVVSDFTRNVIVERYQQDPDKIVTIYNAAESTVCADIAGRPKNSVPVVTFLGRVTYQKGPEYFIRAAHKLIQKNKAIKFIMAGDGDLLPALKMLVSALNLDEYFEFPGFLNAEEVKRLFINSDVFVMPSVSEPFGIVALEAIDASLPIIISKQSGVSEVIQNALKVDAWDTEGIANAIDSVITDSDLSSRLASGAKLESSKLSWDSSAAQLKNIYEELIDNSSRKKIGHVLSSDAHFTCALQA